MEDRIIVFAPRGRDAQVVGQLLVTRGLSAHICADLSALIGALEEGASSAILTEEAVDTKVLSGLSDFIAKQPAWSDFPFVLLTGKGATENRAALVRTATALGNVVLVERPVSVDTLFSTAMSALRARRRQYEARKLLVEKERAASRLLEADRRKDHFLAMLAHELRNPLAPIRSAAEVIKQVEADASPRVQWARQLIERQSRHLSSLLEDLLDISRITTGKVTLKKADLELNVLVQRAVESAQSAIESRGHTITVSLPNELVFVHGDAVRLTQVVGNLLDNAAKYTPPGGQIDLSLATEGDVVTLSIQDNGVGISAEDLPYIFDLFNQADRALDRAQGGLGIGLSLVRSILTMHGGNIIAQSQGQNQGAKMIASIPLLQRDRVLAQAIHKSEAVLLAPIESEHGPKWNIVIIDDNLDSAAALEMLLDLNGHTVRTADTGQAGIDTCLDDWPQVVLLDIGLPGMDGYAVARHLRDVAGNRPLQLFAITGYGQPDDVRRTKEAGFDHHLVKPVEPEALASLLR